MSGIEQFMIFIEVSGKDERLTCTHVSFLAALVCCWKRNGYQVPFQISRKTIMKFARIKSTATYHKCIQEMSAFGYIEYSPTYDPLKGSSINFDVETFQTEGDWH